MKTIKYLFLLGFILVINLNSVNGQSLDSLLQLVVDNNPELKALMFEYEAALTRKNQVNKLPNPQVGIGVPILPPETRLGPQVLMVSVSQMFPWVGTLNSKEDVAISMSKAKYEKITVLKLDLYFELKSTYYQLYFLKNKYKIVSKNILLYESIESTTLAKVESGETTIADVLRIQTELEGLKQQLSIISNQQKGFEIKINTLTKQPFNQALTLPDSLFVPTLSYNMKEFIEKISMNHPIINQLNFEIETSQNTVLMNKNLNNPTVGFGLDYNMVENRNDASPMNNGRDILVPKIMLSIPIYRKSYHAINKEEQFNQAALEERKINVVDKMIGTVAMYKSFYDNAHLSITLYEKQSKMMLTAYEVLLTNYSSSGKGFEELLKVKSQLLGYELGTQEAILQANNAQANIERITKF